MRKLVMSIVIGLGLVVGFGAMSNVNACDDCVIERIETEEHEDCVCGSFQLQCENCGGLYCQEYACECGRCEGIICEESKEETVVMTYDELMIFDEMIWDIYCEEYCINECDKCDYYYYTECMCDACYSDCEDCIFYDYEIFVADNYDMIMDIYEDIMNQLEEYRIAKEREETVIKNVVSEF